MKKHIFFIAAAAILASCTAAKDVVSEKKAERQLRKVAEMAVVKQAVESRKYVIRMDRIYFERGGYADLVPRNNFIIVNGENASVSLGYAGRSFGARPVSGVNFNGQTVKYEFKSDETKGIYSVNMRVKKGLDNFDFYITVGNSGTCSVSMINSYLQSVNYKGTIVPIPSKSEVKVAPPTKI
jgi:opacity protein-like surface antigen